MKLTLTNKKREGQDGVAMLGREGQRRLRRDFVLCPITAVTAAICRHGFGQDPGSPRSSMSTTTFLAALSAESFISMAFCVKVLAY